MKRTTASRVVVAATLIMALCAADVFAAGGRMNRAGQGAGKGTCPQTSSGSGPQTRPAGSQRRDGTFLTTGVTANGSTTRPANGRGVHNGSGVSVPATAPVPASTP